MFRLCLVADRAAVPGGEPGRVAACATAGAAGVAVIRSGLGAADPAAAVAALLEYLGGHA